MNLLDLVRNRILAENLGLFDKGDTSSCVSKEANILALLLWFEAKYTKGLISCTENTLVPPVSFDGPH